MRIIIRRLQEQPYHLWQKNHWYKSCRRSPLLEIMGMLTAKVHLTFSGDKYIRYDVKNDRADEGYPLPIKNNWKGLDAFSEGIDAVFIIPGSSSVYFFKGDQYILYDISKGAALDGYPRKIIGSWKGLECFGSIDAAFSIIDIEGNIKIYFFKGDQYIRYHYLGNDSLSKSFDWDITYSQVRKDMLAYDCMDLGYPASISENWHGLVL